MSLVTQRVITSVIVASLLGFILAVIGASEWVVFFALGAFVLIAVPWTLIPRKNDNAN